jgi:tyrosinase-like protein/polyphenol oxidase-like protein
MPTQLDRRRFVVTAARTIAAAGIAGTPLIRAMPALAAPPVRRNLGGLGINDPILVTYRKAVTAMKALPSTDPRSWTYQAAIHGTLSSPSPLPTAWNTCEHGSPHFWPWHRMYLYYFERIVRKLTGDYGWALPYWDWTSASQRQVPAAFRDPASVLYAPRNAAINSGAGSLPASDVDYSSAFSFTDYVTASGILEGTPHGAVHVDVGGWMGSVPTAAMDPVFWVHHCNIDRLWNLWLAQGGGRIDPLADASWKTQPFTFFDENGNQVSRQSCDVLRTANQLNYGYESEPAEVNDYCIKFIVIWKYLLTPLFNWPDPPFKLSTVTRIRPIDISSLRDRLGAVAAAKNQTLLVKLSNVTTARPPGANWQVYLGLPEGVKPTTDSPYYIGNVALFGMGVRSDTPPNHKFMPATFSFPADKAIAAVLQQQTNSVSLTFVASGPLINGKPSTPKIRSVVQVGRVSFVVQTQNRR